MCFHLFRIIRGTKLIRLFCDWFEIILRKRQRKGQRESGLAFIRVVWRKRDKAGKQVVNKVLEHPPITRAEDLQLKTRGGGLFRRMNKKGTVVDSEVLEDQEYTSHITRRGINSRLAK